MVLICISKYRSHLHVCSWNLFFPTNRWVEGFTLSGNISLHISWNLCIRCVTVVQYELPILYYLKYWFPFVSDFLKYKQDLRESYLYFIKETSVFLRCIICDLYQVFLAGNSVPVTLILMMVFVYVPTGITFSFLHPSCASMLWIEWFSFFVFLLLFLMVL